ncbi:hypothetical protein WR25_13794 [Diploscapter pachys]|uniref:Uncharacterized protein n=1 Tax=Diploscapter pachys TaxID=2018661 RepID=A0A2A2JHV0_9BILA|nr:hypothetical protein WR25_13794 [Diploscapter pachys]
MPLRPDWQFNPSGPELVGNLTRVGRQFYQVKIADQHESERIGIGRQKLAVNCRSACLPAPIGNSTLEIHPDPPG